ncbi:MULTISPECIES: hypothetical protein [unclassified Microbacterium]|uniref:hypothetical protein n=1 Tax=unclassified Microbacterium TaxID=2609290 RepID=UPI00214AAC4E|nr:MULTISPECIES: hypothetical protein [unclassified Microbacterium]MCR2809075.1 hypothetical protein [Microbacterium sp. zg.B185]WIM20231.1 hypothetical protein QNO12_05350 [Microbacterium sp. zg-B185]
MIAVTGQERGPVLEIGAGDKAPTVPLAALGRDLTAIDIDEHRVRMLRQLLPTCVSNALTPCGILASIPFSSATCRTT